MTKFQEMRARFEAATRALLVAEWGNPEYHQGPHNPMPGVAYAAGYLDGCCPVCMGRQWRDGGERQHDTGCPLDVALTAAGLDTQAKRDAARAELEKQQ